MKRCTGNTRWNSFRSAPFSSTYRRLGLEGESPESLGGIEEFPCDFRIRSFQPAVYAPQESRQPARGEVVRFPLTHLPSMLLFYGGLGQDPLLVAAEDAGRTVDAIDDHAADARRVEGPHRKAPARGAP